MDEPKNDIPTPTIDEGDRKPSAITGTGDDGVRRPAPTSPAERSRDVADDRRREPTATMPPEEAGNPDRNTM
jgi:hypothetical protein